jgi:hypothetical protein
MKTSTMRRFCFFTPLTLLICHADAWIELKMLPSWSGITTKLVTSNTPQPSEQSQLEGKKEQQPHLQQHQPQQSKQQEKQDGQNEQQQEMVYPDDVSIMVTKNVGGLNITSATPLQKERERRKLSLGKGKKTNIVSRTVQITSDWNITVWEFAKPAPVVETFNFAKQQGLGAGVTRKKKVAKIAGCFRSF